MALLLDTHVFAWALVVPARIPGAVRDIISDAPRVLVSAVSLFEIGQKARRGKWPDIEPYVDALADLAAEQGSEMAALGHRAAHLAAAFDWPHRDPFDRLIAATAIDIGAGLVTADRAFASLDHPDLRIVWD